MGKKSRRPNRNKPKEIPAVASHSPPPPPPPVASPQEEIATDDFDALDSNQWGLLIDTLARRSFSEDWAGVLELESKAIAMATIIGHAVPEVAGMIYYNLATAHEEMGREGDIEKASVYYKKTVEMAKKAGDNDMVTESVLRLSECYVKLGRAQEAMDLHKSLCEELGTDRIRKDPKAILMFAKILKDNDECPRALEILEEYLEAIESSWGKREQCRAYGIISILYTRKNDYAKSIVYLERQLPIAKETKDVESEGDALIELGRNYGCIGDYGNAMEYLEQSLALDFERGADGRGTYCAMGDVLVAQEGREKEAILMFLKCVGLLEDNNTPSDFLGRVFEKLGNACTKIKAWDDAIAYLEKGLSIAESIEDEGLGFELKAAVQKQLGNTYIEKFDAEESLVGPERNVELIRKAVFCSQEVYTYYKSKGKLNVDILLDLAQEYYFLGYSEKAHTVLKGYLDATVKMGPSYCQACHQTCAKDAIMKKCSVCKVARYCSEAHNLQAWKEGRLCHKVMCPFLKRWRRTTEAIKQGKETAYSLDELLNDFFERVLAFKPK